MSLATKLGTIVGTSTAYVVHYMNKGATPLGLVSLLYTHRQYIQKFAVKHALNKDAHDAVQNNLLECLEYID